MSREEEEEDDDGGGGGGRRRSSRGYVKKIEALRGKQKFSYSLLKIALTGLESELE